MKYTMYVTDAYMEEIEKGTFDLPEKDNFEHKQVGTFDTVAEALEEASNWGSRWAMYGGLVIEDEEGSEVYSDIPAVSRCKCCKHEEWTRLTSDLRAMKKQDGTRLFPEIV